MRAVMLTNGAIDARNLGGHSFLGEEKFQSAHYPNSQPFYRQIVSGVGASREPALDRESHEPGAGLIL